MTGFSDQSEHLIHWVTENNRYPEPCDFDVRLEDAVRALRDLWVSWQFEQAAGRIGRKDVYVRVAGHLDALCVTLLESILSDFVLS